MYLAHVRLVVLDVPVESVPRKLPGVVQEAAEDSACSILGPRVEVRWTARPALVTLQPCAAVLPRCASAPPARLCLRATLLADEQDLPTDWLLEPPDSILDPAPLLSTAHSSLLWLQLPPPPAREVTLALQPRGGSAAYCRLQTYESSRTAALAPARLSLPAAPPRAVLTTQLQLCNDTYKEVS